MNPSEPALRVEEVTDSFDQLAALLDEGQPLETVLGQLVTDATATIPDTGSATVTVVRGTQARTVAASHPWAAELDEHQYAAEDGPCLQAARTGSLVRLDTAAAEHWGDFCKNARSHDVAVMVGVPLLVDGDILETSAALNLTTPNPTAFDPLDEALAELFTHALSAAINHAYRNQHARTLVDQLRQAVDSRDLIGQAKGLLMARHRCGPDEAFEYLRAASQHANLKLRDVAAHYVADETAGRGRDV